MKNEIGMPISFNLASEFVISEPFTVMFVSGFTITISAKIENKIITNPNLRKARITLLNNFKVVTFICS
jgi:hypothetical protein